LGLSAAAFVGSIGVSATVVDGAAVHDSAVMAGMPRALSEFGFFADAPMQMPSGDVVPYQLNTPLYSDGADKLRFIYIPEGKQAVSMGADLIEFPIGSALIKTFAFGEGDDRRLIETRVLLHRADGWTALPYKWNEQQTEATLALAGARIPVTRPDGAEISYRIPNKNQCKTCHSKDGEVIPIGPKARNLSGEWLQDFIDSGHMDTMDDGADTMPHWDRPEGWPAATLARAYLDVNCAHCHQPGGSASNSGLDLRLEQSNPHAIGIRKPPVAAGRGAGGRNVSILPGDPDASIMVHRMKSVEPGVAMPELGKNTVDPDGVDIVSRWIAEMGQ
jgi:uncharacterized repeat protein (TIGR03806 family)